MTSRRRVLAGLWTALVFATGCSPAAPSQPTSAPRAAAPASATQAAPKPTGGSAPTGAAQPASTAAADVPTPGGTLIIGLPNDIAGYYPPNSGGTYFMYDALFNSLVVPSPGGGAPQLDAAESLTPNADFTEYTFKLRAGIKFSDGTPLQASDLVGILAEEQANGVTTQGIMANVDHIEVIDDLTGKFVLKAGDSFFPYTLTTYFRLFKPGQKEKYPTDYVAHPVGTGPFMLQQWNRDEQLVLVKNPNYWKKDAQGNQLPYLDGITFKFASDESSRLATFKSGGYSVVWSGDIDTVSQLLNMQGVSTVDSRNSAVSRSLQINSSVKPTDDLRVRQAMAMAIDRTAVIAAGGGDPSIQIPRTQFFPKSSIWFSQKVEDTAPHYDLEKAKQLLSAYMNDPQRSDGKPAGSPVSIEIKVDVDTQSQSEGAVIQAQWQAAGFDASVKQQAATAQLADNRQGNFISMYRTYADLDPAFLYNLWIGPDYPGGNWTHSNITEAGPLIKKLRVSSQDEAKGIVEQLGLLTNQNLPEVFIQQYVTGFGVNSKVHGLKLLNAADADLSGVYLSK